MKLYYHPESKAYLGFGVYVSVGEWSNVFDEVDQGMFEQKYAIEQGWGLDILG